MTKSTMELNREINALYWEQVIEEACDGDLQAGRFGNKFRGEKTLGNLCTARLMVGLYRNEGAHHEKANAL